MLPKLAPITPDLKALHENGKRLETQVRGLLEHRAFVQAARVFDEQWESTVLPHLPLRVAFVLTRLDRRGVRRFLDLCQEDTSAGAPALELRSSVDPRRPHATAVMIAGEDEVIGFLSADGEGILERAGDHADLYTVKPLVISGIESGQLSFEMELVRPDLKQCTACSGLHAGEADKCDECIEAKRRKKPKAEPEAERPAVPLAGAFRSLSHAEKDR